MPLGDCTPFLFTRRACAIQVRMKVSKTRSCPLGKGKVREGVRRAHEGSFCNLGWMLACSLTRSIRGNPFKFLWSVIWKTDAPPWREVMTDEARK